MTARQLPGRPRDGNSSENFTPRGIEEWQLTFLGDRRRQNLFLVVLDEFRGAFSSSFFTHLKTNQIRFLNSNLKSETLNWLQCHSATQNIDFQSRNGMLWVAMGCYGMLFHSATQNIRFKVEMGCYWFLFHSATQNIHLQVEMGSYGLQWDAISFSYPTNTLESRNENTVEPKTLGWKLG